MAKFIEIQKRNAHQLVDDSLKTCLISFFNKKRPWATQTIQSPASYINSHDCMRTQPTEITLDNVINFRMRENASSSK